jgi:hypothetical protein
MMKYIITKIKTMGTIMPPKGEPWPEAPGAAVGKVAWARKPLK